MLNIGSHLSISKGFTQSAEMHFQSEQTHFNFLHATLVADLQEKLISKMSMHL